MAVGVVNFQDQITPSPRFSLHMGCNLYSLASLSLHVLEGAFIAQISLFVARNPLQLAIGYAEFSIHCR